MKLKLAIVALVVTPLLIAGLASLGTARGKVEAAQATQSSGTGAVVAKVGNQTITLDQLDKKALGSSFQVFQQLYEARRKALDNYIGDILMEQQAKAKGITKEDLEKQEITAKIQPVTDADVQSWFNANQNRVGGRKMEDIAPQIKSYLEKQRQTEARDNYINALKKAANVKITLEPPRQEVKLSANDPARGPATAPVTIVEFSDFQ